MRHSSYGGVAVSAHSSSGVVAIFERGSAVNNNNAYYGLSKVSLLLSGSLTPIDRLSGGTFPYYSSIPVVNNAKDFILADGPDGKFVYYKAAEKIKKLEELLPEKYRQQFRFDPVEEYSWEAETSMIALSNAGKLIFEMECLEGRGRGKWVRRTFASNPDPTQPAASSLRTLQQLHFPENYQITFIHDQWYDANGSRSKNVFGLTESGLLAATITKIKDNLGNPIPENQRKKRPGLLPSIVTTFEKVGDNEEITDNKYPKAWDTNGIPNKWEWMPGKGKRVFPDAKTATETTPRDKVYVKVQTVLPKDTKVFLKVFDVDDPTPQEKDQEYKIDSNDQGGEKGSDNRGRFAGNVPAKFTSSGIATVECKTDIDGIAKVNGQLPEMQISKNAGDNFRVAVSLMGQEELDLLQVSNKEAYGYIPSGDEPIKGIGGAISPMLTVWRKLHVEQDSMLWPTTKPAPDRQMASGGSWGTLNQGGGYTQITCNVGQSVVANFYSGGRVISGNTEIKIRRTGGNTAGSGGITITLDRLLSASEKSGFGLSSFEVRDDDDKPLPSGASAPLPKQGMLTNKVKGTFYPAYIEVVEGLASYNNVNVPFQLNRPAGNSLGSGVESNATIPNSDNHWACTITAGYQTVTAGDQDPDIDEETGAFAETDTGKGISLIYLEHIRESSLNSDRTAVRDDHFNMLLPRVVAHEIGHCPLSGGGELDHGEGGLMDPLYLEVEGEEPEFTPTTLNRMRNADKWRR